MKTSIDKTFRDEVAGALLPGAAATAGLLRALAATVTRIAADLRLRRKARLVHETLGQLDDRTLNDLGLHRSEVAVFGAVVDATSPAAVRDRLALHAVPR